MTSLKGQKPMSKNPRLKLLMYGNAGVGKTTASCMLPRPYIIDSEHGTDHYADLINKAGGVVHQTTDMAEVIEDVRKLSTEEHPYKTVVIDPITPLYFDLVEKCEEEVGSEWGRHYGEANKHMKRLVNLLMRLDMNVVVTAHEKTIYGDDMKKTGITFDGWKKLDYIFDLVLELKRKTPTKRFAKVVKSRIESFPDGESFEWNYSSLTDRYSQDEIERDVEVVETITKEQIEEINLMSEKLTDGQEFVDKMMRRAKVDIMSDLTFEQADKLIAYFHKTLGIKKGK